MSRELIIETREQAIAYLEKVLTDWPRFCETHRPITQAIEIMLKEVSKDEK